MAETSRIGVSGGAVSNVIICEQGDLLGESRSDMGSNAPSLPRQLNSSVCQM